MLYYVCLALEWPVRLLLYLLLKNRSIMIQDELRALYDQMSDEEKNENSVLKGRFTKYITRRLEWHAIRYAAHKRKSIVTISLDDILDVPQDERAAEMLREVEIEVALQQELQRLNQEKKLLVYLLALDIDKIALQIDCSVSNVYRKRRHLSNKVEGLKG